MKIYLKPDTSSRGIMRVVKALEDYAPSFVDIVQRPQDADLEVIHVYGRYEAIKQRIKRLQKVGKPYAMIQYAIRSTMHPETSDWMELWNRSKIVWSYYNLPVLSAEDGTYEGFNFYYAPLGVDPSVFYRRETGSNSQYTIAACSKHALAEGARECAFATKRVNHKMFFLGHELRRGEDIVCKQNISDDDLAHYYSECMFVSGLRRIEGFELPVIEGALCGARPIVFDQPHYREWFRDFAIFIPETDRDGVIDNLEKIFRQAIDGRINYGVTAGEQKMIRERFDWGNIINGFYQRLQ